MVILDTSKDLESIPNSSGGLDVYLLIHPLLDGLVEPQLLLPVLLPSLLAQLSPHHPSHVGLDVGLPGYPSYTLKNNPGKIP